MTNDSSKNKSPLGDTLADLFRAVEEDRAEIDTSSPVAPISGVDDDANTSRNRPSVVVVPTIIQSSLGSKDRDAVRKSFAPIGGKPFPLVSCENSFDVARRLTFRFPHLSQAIFAILMPLAGQKSVWIRPTILIGEPGSGKTTLAKAIAQELGLPSVVYNAGGVSDASFGGTSAQWSTAGASVPLQLVREGKVANPLIVVDEIEKSSDSTTNGRLYDGLLALLDRGNASSYREPGLEMPVDLSHVSYVLTANSLAGIPDALKDRCRVIKVPTPGLQHIGPIVNRIVNDLALEHGFRPEFIEPLAQDEIELIGKAWDGGSIRRLRRIVEVFVDGRSMTLGRC